MTSRGPRIDEHGFALATVVIVLTTMTLMVTGVFFLSFSEQRLGAASVALLQARLAAEAGLVTASERGGVETRGSTSGSRTSDLAGGGSFEAQSLSLGPRFLIVESVGLGPAARARHAVAEIWEGRPPDLRVRSSLAIRDGPPRPDWLDVSDYDEAWTGGDCPLPGRPSETISVRVEPDGVVPTGPDREHLTDQADVLVGGGIVVFPGPSYRADGSCDTGDSGNWGDPTGSGRDCGSYFPVVHSKRDLKIVGGVGQGVIFVDGNLEVSGGFDFSGVIIVAGRLSSGETGVRVVGSVIAESVDFWESSRRNLTTVVFSPCAVQKALRTHLVFGPLPQRAWVGPN